ncbi:hypothetical protein [Rhodopseudomonas palustris]|uniref:hypothetical protein n=1 Tax=Rhodopseudomonas palustris TaxID=1076 RepID=UPI000E5A98BF|nr:hypothetical protein [Rhodopseudomonas palustris]QLH72596.1 hypothetical protein HZF03_18080 [Rhodopseudomonas palustris]RIA03904.1 hypothetical protein D1920_00200 [Rhodopseudomonas palustris]
MSQLTFQLDENSEKAIEELKEFFGTKSSAAAVRSALALVRTLAPASKDRTVVIRDQNKDEDLKIVMAG